MSGAVERILLAHDYGMMPEASGEVLAQFAKGPVADLVRAARNEAGIGLPELNGALAALDAWEPS